MRDASQRSRGRRRGQPNNRGQFVKEPSSQAEACKAHDVDLGSIPPSACVGSDVIQGAITDEMIQEAISDPTGAGGVRLVDAIADPETESEELERLPLHHLPWMAKTALARNPRTSTTVLNRLESDPTPRVASAARKALEERERGAHPADNSFGGQWADNSFGGQWADTPRERLGGAEHYLRLHGEAPARRLRKKQMRIVRRWEKHQSRILDEGKWLYTHVPRKDALRIERAYPINFDTIAEQDLWDASEVIRGLVDTGEFFDASDISKRVRGRRRALFGRTGAVRPSSLAITAAMLEQTRQEDRMEAFDSVHSATSPALERYDRPWADNDPLDLLNRYRNGV